MTTKRPVSAAPLLTVAVVSWNTSEALARCLRSFADEVATGRTEVWVVDNASSDGSAEVVREQFRWAKLIASEKNLGFGRAVNLVARRTSSPWLASANADIILRPGAIEVLLDAGRRDRRAGALAPRLVLPGGAVQHSVFGFPTLIFSLYLATGAFRLSHVIGDRMAFPGFWNTERSRRVPWAVAAFLVFRREAFEEAGGFDERQWLYAEDLDIGWRLKRAGWATRYEPRAIVHHEEAAATTQLFGSELAPHWQRSTYGFLARRRGSVNARAVAILNLTGALWRWARTASRVGHDKGLVDLRDAQWRWVKVHADAARMTASDLRALR